MKESNRKELRHTFSHLFTLDVSVFPVTHDVYKRSKNTLNSIISTQKYSQNVYENTITGENYEKYPTTNSYLGWARIFKTGRLPNFSCGVMDSGNDADPMHYA